MKTQVHAPALLLAGFAVAALSGCATAPKPMYSWGAYQPQVYSYLNGGADGVEAQIGKLEESAEQAKAHDAPLPPGYHAHLGMLYAKVGRSEQVRQQFETEKALYPESSTFIDFLSRTFAKNQQEQP